MTAYRVTLTSEYGYIEQTFRDLMRARHQIKIWRLKFPAATIKINRTASDSARLPFAVTGYDE